VLLPVGERIRIGYVEHRGAGRVIVMGVLPTPELLIALHAWLGIRLPSRALSARVQSALFRRGLEYFAVVTNTSPDAREVSLLLDVDPLPGEVRDLRSGCRAPVVDGRVVVQVPGRSGTAVRLT
jgi:hypothetical protein